MHKYTTGDGAKAFRRRNKERREERVNEAIKGEKETMVLGETKKREKDGKLAK